MCGRTVAKLAVRDAAQGKYICATEKRVYDIFGLTITMLDLVNNRIDSLYIVVFVGVLS